MIEGSQPDLLTVQEAAAQIGVTEAAIRTATLNGRLPFVRKHGRSWIEPSELRTYQARIQPPGEKLKGRSAKEAKT
jgi:excisionase family DNA binding protein